MAQSRINPLLDLKQTANDLAILIVYGDKDVKKTCLYEAKAIYQQPLNSWLTGLFYRLANSRTRFPILDLTIAKILSNQDGDNSEEIIDIFSSGGWQETSFNTTLIRSLVRHLQYYDTTIALPLSVVIELKVLLIFAQARLLNEDQITKQQTVIDTLKAKKIEMHNDLIELTRLLRDFEIRRAEIEVDEHTSDARLQELTAMCEKQEQVLDQYQQQLKQLDIEKQKQEEELENKKRLALDTRIDISKLTDAQMEEAKQIAATAINMYMRDLETQGKEKVELNNVTSGKLSQATQLLANNSLFKGNAVARQAELSAIPVASGVNDDFKNALATLLGGRAVPAKKPMESVRRTELKSLYSTGQAVIAKADVPPVIMQDYKPEKAEAVSFAATKVKMATLFVPRAPKPAPVEEVKPLPNIAPGPSA